MAKDGLLGFESAAALNQFNQSIIEEFRANGGRCGGRFEGNPMVLVSHQGAKSKRWFTTPLSYSGDGDDVIVMASAGGGVRHPKWYFNLLMNPKVVVERGSERYDAQALILESDARSEAFRKMTEAMPRFADYQARVSREVSVIRLRRSA